MTRPMQLEDLMKGEYDLPNSPMFEDARDKAAELIVACQKFTTASLLENANVTRNSTADLSQNDIAQAASFFHAVLLVCIIVRDSSPKSSGMITGGLLDLILTTPFAAHAAPRFSAETGGAVAAAVGQAIYHDGGQLMWAAHARFLERLQVEEGK